MPLRPAAPTIRSIDSSTHARRSNGIDSRVMLPASTFEKSRMSLMMVSRWLQLVRMVLANSRCSVSRWVSSSRLAKPTMAFIGVRIS